MSPRRHGRSAASSCGSPACRSFCRRSQRSAASAPGTSPRGRAESQNVELSLRVDFAGEPQRPPLALDQSFEGASAAGDAVGFLMAVLAYLTQNDLAPLDIGGIAVDVRMQAEPRAATLTFVRPSRTRIAPGETLDLQIDARGWRGESVRWSERVVVPSGLPDGRYSFLVGDGASSDGARLALAPAPPTGSSRRSICCVRCTRAATWSSSASFPAPAFPLRASCCRDSLVRCGRSGERWGPRAPPSCAMRSCRVRRVVAIVRSRGCCGSTSRSATRRIGMRRPSERRGGR